MSLSSPLWAEGDLEMRVSKIESQLRESSTKNARGTFGGKLADASPNVDGYGFYISTDAILYKLYEDNNGYASEFVGNAAGDFEATSGPSQLYSSNFDWSFGFKTGLGYYAEHDFWQSGFEFTYLKTYAKSTKTTDASHYLTKAFDSTPTAQSLFTAPYTSASDRWKVTFYNLDWRIGKDFFVSKYLSFLPEVGIKTAWFYQNRNLSYTLPINSSTDFAGGTTNRIVGSDHYVGVGPKADLVAKFFLGKNFSIIGSADVALLYATNKTSYTQNLVGYDDDDQTTSINRNLSSSTTKYHMSPYLGLSLGMGYDTNFNDDAFNLEIKLAYELQYYNKASRLFQLDEPSAFDLSMQGIDLSFVISF